MVIFVNPEMLRVVEALRKMGSTYPTLLIPRFLESFLVYSILSKEEWKRQEEIDLDRPNNPGHNKDLYMVWNEKTNMMKLVRFFFTLHLYFTSLTNSLCVLKS